MACGQYLTSCLFLCDFKSRIVFVFKQLRKIHKSNSMYITLQWYTIKMSMSINKVLLAYKYVHSIPCFHGYFCTTAAVLIGATHKTKRFTIWPITEKVCQPLFDTWFSVVTRQCDKTCAHFSELMHVFGFDLLCDFKFMDYWQCEPKEDFVLVWSNIYNVSSWFYRKIDSFFLRWGRDYLKNEA